MFSGLPGGLVVKNLLSNAGDTSAIPGSGRSPGVGNGYPLQYSCLESSMDGEAGQATICGVAKDSDTTERMHAHTCVHAHTLLPGYTLS